MDMLEELLHFDWQSHFDIFLKLCLTGFLGLVIGIEREMKRKPVGLKTSTVIAIVSCMLTVISIEAPYITPDSDKVNITMDPLRLAAQIISGIGFLGAGVILRRENDTITGLTTAAMIWGAAGIGVAVGAGFYFEAIAGVILILVSVELIPPLMNFIGPKQLSQKEIMLQLIVSDKKNIGLITKKIKDEDIDIKNIRIKDSGNTLIVQLIITVHYQRLTVDVYTAISKIQGIQAVEIENL